MREGDFLLTNISPCHDLAKIKYNHNRQQQNKPTKPKMKKYLFIPIVLGGIITLTVYAQNKQSTDKKSEAAQCCKQKDKAKETVAKTDCNMQQCPMMVANKQAQAFQCKMHGAAKEASDKAGHQCPMMAANKQAQGFAAGQDNVVGNGHQGMMQGRGRRMGPGMMMQGRGRGMGPGMMQGMNPEMMQKMMQMMHGKSGHQGGQNNPSKGNPHHGHKK
jgi:hypothetical protein